MKLTNVKTINKRVSSMSYENGYEDGLNKACEIAEGCKSLNPHPELGDDIWDDACQQIIKTIKAL
jgi:hypothetical protein